ncbi:MAG: SUMF1/EgtB/PvdO family nonheme iron enzyme [Crocinitomix sp.]|nr:SUMF1/EgtB/PvdO family nonheme iron enzyme [Crocinitomix sp.]
MKPLFILLILFIFSALDGYTADMASKALHSSSKKEIVPPGTVKFNEGLYVDMTELSNFNWLEYMSWMKINYGKTSKQYAAALPDTLIWRKTNIVFEEWYLRHPSYHNHPVVGVSYEQAIAYCAWRSDRVNEMLFAKNNTIEYHFYKEDATFCKIPKICTYRLPTEKEWESFAIAPFSKKVLRKQKDDRIYNTVFKPTEIEHNDDDSEIIAPVISYWPNSFGMYNLIGNVAEMTAEKGKSKGGSWSHTLESSSVDSSVAYTTPTNWLGFRCVCEVKLP